MTLAAERQAPTAAALPAAGPATPPAPPAAGRDRSIDAVRASLLVTVVGMHAMMVGVSVGAAGPVLENALENQTWFAPVSWVLQVMPLFFIVGGFSSITQWRTMRAAGRTPADYVRGRLERLIRPAIALVAVVAVALTTMTALGVPADMVATAGFRIGQPMWFLGVYILCSALVPLMVRAHTRARIATPLLLLAAIVMVDATRVTFGIDAIGFVNLLFVWLLVQQLGFWLADGHVDALSRRTRVGILVIALGTLAALTGGVIGLGGPYSPDMLENLNPPTVCLVVLGVAQLMVFSLLRPRIAALAEREPVRTITDQLGSRSMTVYLWHMPVLIALAAALLVINATTGIALPEPLSPLWWGSRPLWLAVAGVAVVPVVLLFARFERGRRGTQSAKSVRGAAAAPTAADAPTAPDAVPSLAPARRYARFAAADTVLGAAGVATALVAGFAPLPAGICLALLVTALIGTRRLVSSTSTVLSQPALSTSFGWMTRTNLWADARQRPAV